MNLHGPVRVADAAPAGQAEVTLSLPNWPGQPVASTTHPILVKPFVPPPRDEPLAKEFVATLPHPVETCGVSTIKFSPDGTRLFAAGYPSGVVQFFDLATRRELRRIETPPGGRGSLHYALLTPDWATLFVPVQRRTVTAIERDGKPAHRIAYAGEVRGWDVATGTERPALVAPAGAAPDHAELSPDGRTLLVIEHATFDRPGSDEKGTTLLIDVASGARRTLFTEGVYGQFAPDGRTLYLNRRGNDEKDRIMRVDAATGRPLAEITRPADAKMMQTSEVSPDGAAVVAMVGGTKGAQIDVRFLDPTTLAERGRLTGPGAADRYGWGFGRFTPDGKRYVLLDGAGNARVWNVGGRTLERVVPLGTDQQTHTLTISPDGRTLAVAWIPKPATDDRAPAAADLPQARVVLVDLGGAGPPRTLVGPRGYPVALAFAPDGKTLALGGWGGVHLFTVR